MSKKILIIDDDLYLRELYEDVLSHEGYIVETSPNGVEGLGKIQQGGYDLILLDIVMPKLDGLKILDAMHENPPQVKNGPVILLTNLGHEQVMKDANDKGAAEYLIKADITPDELVKHVKKQIPE